MNLKRIFCAVAIASTSAFASGGSGGGGGGSTTTVNPLPTTPPSPDVVVRESFGPRPAALPHF